MIYQYIVCEDPDDYAAGIFCDAGTSAPEAKALAQKHNACVVELTYEFSDSELIEDFREVE